ncbi:MAG: ADP-ribosylglycohydrolase family protein, partial [Candidatus Marinimicrobia bacterium]|nr:ADP-ribosylglycohydrolase family protein [Candidatus Neomarinimicrobiota bacterium]
RAFGRKFSDHYNIHRTRIGFPNNGLDTFYNMSKMGIYVVDRIVQERMGGGIDLDKGVWYVPDVGIDIIPGLQAVN